MDVIVRSARAVLIDENQSVLLIKRMDNSAWGLPAGATELGESISQCMEREVREETGLTVVSATPAAFYTEPRFSYENAHGRKHCTFAVSFRVSKWEGLLLRNTGEAIDASFFGRNDMPNLVYSYEEVISDAFGYDGGFIAK
jgi:ADP-ribose pyrophosphatase YjhB (NUDIX family)